MAADHAHPTIDVLAETRRVRPIRAYCDASERLAEHEGRTRLLELQCKVLAIELRAMICARQLLSERKTLNDRIDGGLAGRIRAEFET